MPFNKPVRRVAIIVTRVVGASWSPFYLARGFNVVATDPAAQGEGPFGTLVLDVAVPDPPKVVWRAIGQAEIDLEKPDAQRAARIRSVVRDVVAKLPRKK